VLFMASILLVWGMGKTISENDRWHHYLKGKAREKRQSKKTTPFYQMILERWVCQQSGTANAVLFCHCHIMPIVPIRNFRY
ncbi:hypothetical protein P9091_09670, partial [Gallibacterium anatis]